MYKKIIISLALDHGISEKALEAARKLLRGREQHRRVARLRADSGTAAAYVSQEDVAKSFQAAKRQAGRTCRRSARR